MQIEDRSRRIIDWMRGAGSPASVIDDFVARYQQWRQGWSGKVEWDSISPPAAHAMTEIAALRRDEANIECGRSLLDRLVCIKLNGGLGTTMHLATTKSLIPVRGGRTFLELIVEQIKRLRAAHGARTPLLLMNSHRTHQESLAHLGDSLSQPDGLPLDFLQYKVPRIDTVTGGLLDDSTEERELWAPAGHGAIYRALWLGGLLDQLIDAGYRWAFVANTDNLGATVEPSLLGHLHRAGLDFAMEVTDKTAADIKGGTLVEQAGRLTLLERAQVDDDHIADFEDTAQLPVFNTNNLWFRLEAVRRKLAEDGLEMPTIVNPKQVGGRRVVQLEIAMGAVIGCFDRAVGVRVARRRFAPVKDTADLLGVRSDAYALDEQGGLRPARERPAELGPPVIRLDPRHYASLEGLDRLCPNPLSLVRCRSLRVEGEVEFGEGVVVEGDAVVRNASSSLKKITDGTRIGPGRLDL